MAPNLGWTDVPLGERLIAVFGDEVPIYVANEADLGALAEARRGAARGADHVLFISGEVGVGGGLIVDGQPFTGVAGYGGEIGHMPVNANGPPATAGRSAAGRPRSAPTACCAAPAARRRAVGPPSTPCSRGASAGSPVDLAALEETGRWLAFGLAGLVNILNPRLVVMGGQFARILPFVDEVVKAGLDRYALSAPRRLVRVVPATLGADAPLLGAAEHAFEPLLADPAGWVRPRAGLTELASA